ncbi:30S ribosomal protein S1 [Sulfidibacter corallicola]|uniref:Small ribosomal subunit protein bS1 n=1 Tax=Sulfidibacter corallicola TaxID=2818388 RepID=A0A8A4TGB1_SULCO|nr:30S ribosomal protein S1 [Sulfidibacter corallicola]QTD48244.1 30S ribosomal protein S1 [Sulfidibacter corallicola]
MTNEHETDVNQTNSAVEEKEQVAPAASQEEVKPDQEELKTEEVAEAKAEETVEAVAEETVEAKAEETVEAVAEETVEAKAEETVEAKAEAKAPASTEDQDDEEDLEAVEGKSFEELLEEYDQFREYRPGEIVTGTVVNIGEQDVVIDIGARVEGTVPSSEFMDEEGNCKIKEAEKIDVMVLRFNPEAQHIPLSFERARISRVWDQIEEVANTEETLKGSIIEKVKGGFIVDVGVRAFLPTSQATLKPQKDYQDLLGKKYDFSILKIQRRRGNLILSRKDLLQSEYEEKRKDLFDKLKEGAVLDGTVKNVTDYGAFIDLGGLDGLLHISDMSWGRINHPKDLVSVDDVIKVKVLRFDPEKEKVSLGLKQCAPDPWLSVSENYPPGKSVKGKVLNLTSYGAFVELEPGVEGMIHVSEMSWTKKVRNPGQILQKGDDVSVKVLDLDSDKRRVSLSLKQTEDNPWESLAERFPVGSKVKGRVRNITEFGAFVEIEDGIDGLVHVSDFKWGERTADPNEYVKKSEEVEVVILAVDTENKKVSLGMKQLALDPWLEFTKTQREGDYITAAITKVTDFGVFLQLAEHVEGLVRNNELDIPRGAKPGDHYQEGQEIQVIISRISHRERKVDLSVRRLRQDQERRAVQEYTKQNDKGGATMGDVMAEGLRHLINK